MNPWVRAACGRDPLRSMRETRGWELQSYRGRPLMAILAGFDVHRAQITFDALNTETGEVLRGRLRADREAVGAWVGQFAGEHVEVAVEACTGWLFVYEVLAGGGGMGAPARPGGGGGGGGKKPHPKTHRARARGRGARP